MSHSPSPDKPRLAALPVVTGSKGCMTVCNSVNNVNNFPLSSCLAYSVIFVSNYIQEASMQFKPLWRENGSRGIISDKSIVIIYISFLFLSNFLNTFFLIFLFSFIINFTSG